MRIAKYQYSKLIANKLTLEKLIQKIGYWCAYWLPTVFIGLVAFIVNFKRKGGQIGDSPRILVVMIEHIGDLIVSVPFLRMVRSIWPRANVTVIISRSAHSILEHCPYIDNLIISDGGLSWGEKIINAVALGCEIRASQFDLAFVPKDAPNKDFNELICLMGACRRRISRVRPRWIYRIKPLKFFPFYDKIIVDSMVRHEVEQRLQILRDFSDFSGFKESYHLEAWLAQSDLYRADDFLSSIDAKKGAPMVAFGIGASARGRQWPLKNFVEVIQGLSDKYGIVAILISGPSEIELVEELVRHTQCSLHYLKNATVRESMAIMRRCAMFVGNDSGPMHMAAAVGLPVVEISVHPIGATPWNINSPERFGPYGVPSKIIRPKALNPRCKNGCVSGHKPHCIAQISPDNVIEAASEFLDSFVRG